MSVADDELDSVGDRLALENAESEVMLSDIDRRLFLDSKEGGRDDSRESVFDRMLIKSLSDIVLFKLCLYSSSPSSIDLSESSSSGMPKSASVISALSRLLTATTV